MENIIDQLGSPTVRITLVLAIICIIGLIRFVLYFLADKGKNIRGQMLFRNGWSKRRTSGVLLLMVPLIVVIASFIFMGDFQFNIILLVLTFVEEVAYSALPERVYENGIEVSLTYQYVFYRWNNVVSVEQIDDSHYKITFKSNASMELSLPENVQLPLELRHML